MVGLGDVNNTTDLNKPVSTATQTAINTKVNVSDTMTMLSKYLRKADFPSGSNVNEILYWNGSKWITLAPGTTGQSLIMSSTGLSWGCIITNTVAAASSSPTLLVNTALPTPITIATTGATGIDTTNSGLPAGVTASWLANVITISGTPTAVGTFNYTFSLTGGCGSVNATGTIVVSAASPPPSCEFTFDKKNIIFDNYESIEIGDTPQGVYDTYDVSGLPSETRLGVSSGKLTIFGATIANPGKYTFSFKWQGGLCEGRPSSGEIEVVL
jgi:hypothetical protein